MIVFVIIISLIAILILTISILELKKSIHRNNKIKNIVNIKEDTLIDKHLDLLYKTKIIFLSKKELIDIKNNILYTYQNDFDLDVNKFLYDRFFNSNDNALLYINEIFLHSHELRLQ